MVETPYYLTHFRQVVDTVSQHYESMLTPKERVYVEKLGLLSLKALCLYVRLVNRKGPYFRLSKLDYVDCEPLAKGASELLASGLLTICDNDALPYGLDEVWGCFSHSELRELFKDYKGQHTANKNDYCIWLEDQKLHSRLLNRDLIALKPDDSWSFIKFLYFGELTDNLSGFVVQELGHIVTEQTEAVFTAQFVNRKEADDCFRLAELYKLFKELRGRSTANDLYSWWQRQAVMRDSLSVKALPAHDKLVAKLGYELERGKNTDLAKQLYQNVSSAPCRERYAKLLAKAGDKDAAISLCRSTLLAPEHADEAYAMRQLLNRLEGIKRSSDARGLLKDSEGIQIRLDSHSVEIAALEYYRAQGWQGVHSENWLWNALFGLFFWDIIYDASYNSFHQPLQIGPSDLYQKRFYEVRKFAIESRLKLLDNKIACVERLRIVYKAKAGITNPFLGWYDDTLPLLDKLVTYLPAKGLAAVLRHIAQDVKRHSRGFPDLFLWRNHEYMLREVKSQNDHISPQQFTWLHFFQQNEISASALRVSDEVDGKAVAYA